MNREQLKLQIPQGVRDLLPDEAFRKRLLEKEFEKVFALWGYKEVVTPSFEYYDSLSVGRSGEEDARIYKFIDRQGHILALRPDMTTPIARLVSTRMRNSNLPIRLFYNMASVFSFENPQAGRQREFYQSGVEMIGDSSPFADAEVIAVAVETLKASGLENFKVSIGHVDILYGIMEELGLPDEQKGRIKSAVSSKNYVGLQELLDEFNIPASGKELFMQLITMRGGRRVIDRELKNDRLNRKIQNAFESLNAVYSALEAYEMTDSVEIDLGVLRGLDYYTGVVFEGYSAFLGFPVLGGGRYDNLMEQFGYNCPATGFAVGMERLLLSLEREGKNKSCGKEYDHLIEYKPSEAAQALQKARTLREQGYIVVTRMVSG